MNPGCELGKYFVYCFFATNRFPWDLFLVPVILSNYQLIVLDLGWVNKSRVSLYTVKDIAAHFQDSRILEGKYEAAWQLRALTCIDLTTLAGDDTDSNVSRLCCKVRVYCTHELIKNVLLIFFLPGKYPSLQRYCEIIRI